MIKDESGEIVELRCTYDPETRGGNSPDGRKVKATMHWVSARHCSNAQVRLYDTLFTEVNPNKTEEGGDWLDNLNPKSLEVLPEVKIEPALLESNPGDLIQFERIGYFTPDSKDSQPGAPVFNRTVTLRDTWARIQKRKG